MTFPINHVPNHQPVIFIIIIIITTIITITIITIITITIITITIAIFLGASKTSKMWKKSRKIPPFSKPPCRWDPTGTCPQQRALGHRVAVTTALAQQLQLLKAKVPGPGERARRFWGGQKPWKKALDFVDLPGFLVNVYGLRT